MDLRAFAAASLVVGTIAATPASAEPPWIDAAAQKAAGASSTDADPGAAAPVAPPADTDSAATAVAAALEAARAALVASLSADSVLPEEPEAVASLSADSAVLPSPVLPEEPEAAASDGSDAAILEAVRAARAAMIASLAPSQSETAAPAAGAEALSLPEAFVSAHAETPVQVAALPAQDELAAAEARNDDRPVRLVVLPLPPEKPWPGLDATSVPLPRTGLSLRVMPALPRLQARGTLASFADGRPYAHFDRQLDCIVDHQRFDQQERRQKFAHVCAPTRDLDVGLPAFTTR